MAKKRWQPFENQINMYGFRMVLVLEPPVLECSLHFFFYNFKYSKDMNTISFVFYNYFNYSKNPPKKNLNIRLFVVWFSNGDHDQKNGQQISRLYYIENPTQ
jgi:hypothetical protein